jgi:hypothetical protein
LGDQPLKEGLVEFHGEGVLVHGRPQLDVVADEDGFLAPLHQRDQGLWLRLLRCLVDDDYVEEAHLSKVFCTIPHVVKFRAEETKSSPDAGGKNDAALSDLLLCLVQRFTVGVDLLSHPGITGVLPQVFSYLPDLG